MREQWAKLHTYKLDDARFMRLTTAQLGRWMQLLLLAKRCDENGALLFNGKELTAEDFATLFRSDIKEVRSDLSALKSAKLIFMNGRGWEITDYATEQEPKPNRDYNNQKQKEHRERAKSSSVNDMSMTVNDISLKESESDRDIELNKEDLKIVSQSVKPDGLTDELLRLVGIPKDLQEKIKSTGISRSDLLAELSRNYNRKKSGAVRSPGRITAMNLINHELPSAEWYSEDTWTRYLPSAMSDKLGLIHSETNLENDTSNILGYTNCKKQSDNKDIPAEIVDAWRDACGELFVNGASKNMISNLESTGVDGYDGKTLTIRTPLPQAVDYLAGRARSSLQRIMVGILDKSIDIVFVGPED